MILEKLQGKKEFTNSEKEIVEFIFNHLTEFQKMTSEELARQTHTSKSSVIRLCKKIGVSGYQELKKLIYAEEKTAKKGALDKISTPLNQSSFYAGYIESIKRLYDGVIMDMNVCLNQNTINRVINRINHNEKIDFYASGLSYAIAEATAHKYNTLGVLSSAFSSINEAFLASNHNNTKTTAFIISLSGNNPLAIHHAEVLKRYGVYVVGIVGRLSKEMMKHCDEIIPLVATSALQGSETIAITFSINYIFDILFLGLLAKRYDKQLELQKKINYDYKK